MPSSRLRLSLEAEDDLRDILQYTLDNWGQAQHDAYAARLDRGLAHLADFPKIGRLRPDFGPDVRGYLIHHYLVVYRLESDEIVVSRIVHSGWDSGSKSRR
jgi:toxin ParE1/3/4